MSIASLAVSEAPIGTEASPIRKTKPPGNRRIVAKADTVERPEAR
jgi:hypothetical protein